MTVLIAKVISRISTPLTLYDAGVFAMPKIAVPRFSILPSVKREFLTLAFLFFAALAAVIYIIEMNVIIFEGKKLPLLDITLQELQRDQKIKDMTLGSMRSPLAVKQEAVDGIKMVDVKSVHYLEDAEPVAVNTLKVP